jgi:hypothetical protein
MAIEINKLGNSSNNNRMYREQIVTREDLNEFRTQLLTDFKEIILNKPEQSKQWLKSNEVRKLLNISAGTLQTLRINGILTYSKIGGIIYYKYEDIVKLLEKK